MKFNMLEDLSTITTIPLLPMQELFQKGAICICDNVNETLKNKENECEIDIGIGKLLLRIDTEYIEYKFIPSSKLEENLINTINTRESPLINELEEALSKRIMNVYKDLF